MGVRQNPNRGHFRPQICRPVGCIISEDFYAGREKITEKISNKKYIRGPQGMYKKIYIEN